MSYFKKKKTIDEERRKRKREKKPYCRFMIYISHKKWTLTVFFGAKVDEDVVEEVVCAHVQGPLIIRLSIDLYARVVTVAVQYERKGIVYLSGEYQKI